MTSVGAVMTTVGRYTPAHAVASALREGFEVVASDGFDVSDPCVCQPGVKYARRTVLRRRPRVGTEGGTPRPTPEGLGSK